MPLCLWPSYKGSGQHATFDYTPARVSGRSDIFPAPCSSNGSLVNPNSGQCLDDTGYGGSGTHVQIWSCTGNPNQEWTLP